MQSKAVFARKLPLCLQNKADPFIGSIRLLNLAYSYLISISSTENKLRACFKLVNLAKADSLEVVVCNVSFLNYPFVKNN